MVYGERRLGKSAALELAAASARRAGHKVVIFNLGTAIDPQDALQRLIKAVHQAIGRSWKTMFQDLAARLKFSVTITPRPEAGGLPEVSIGLEPGARTPLPAMFTDALDALEAELRRRRLKLGLGIDEFQRLLHWGGEDIEWSLKASFERHTHLSYVLAGSARSLIEEMVTSKHRALWKTVETMSIGPIDSREFADWIVERSRGSGVAVSPEVAARIVALAGPRTRDVIVLAAGTWEDARVHGGPGDPGRALAEQVAQTADLHARIWVQRTERERKLLRLLAMQPAVEPTAHAVRTQYRLGASSTVTKALAVLVTDEILARAAGGYVFDDPFFRSWVAQSTGGDLGPAPPG